MLRVVWMNVEAVRTARKLSASRTIQIIELELTSNSFFRLRFESLSQTRPEQDTRLVIQHLCSRKRSTNRPRLIHYSRTYRHRFIQETSLSSLILLQPQDFLQRVHLHISIVSLLHCCRRFREHRTLIQMLPISSIKFSNLFHIVEFHN